MNQCRRDWADGGRKPSGEYYLLQAAGGAGADVASAGFGQTARHVQIQAPAWERYQQQIKGMRPNNPSGEPQEALEPAEPAPPLAAPPIPMAQID